MVPFVNVYGRNDECKPRQVKNIRRHSATFLQCDRSIFTSDSRKKLVQTQMYFSNSRTRSIREAYGDLSLEYQGVYYLHVSVPARSLSNTMRLIQVLAVLSKCNEDTSKKRSGDATGE